MKADTLFRKFQTQRFHSKLYFSPSVSTLDTGTADNYCCRTAFAGLGLWKQLISGPAVESKKAEGQKGGPSPGEESLGIPWCYQLLHETAVIASPHGKASLLPGSFQNSAWGSTPAGCTGHQGPASWTTCSVCFLQQLGVSWGWKRLGHQHHHQHPCPTRITHPSVTSAGNSQPPCLTVPALNKALINHNFLLFPSFTAWPLTDTSKSGISCQRGFLLRVFMELPLWMLHVHKWIDSS